MLIQKKGIEAAKKMLKSAGIMDNDENIFIAATCKDKGLSFLKGEAKVGVRKNVKKTKATHDSSDGYTVSVNHKDYSVVINGDKATVNGKEYAINVKDGVSVSGSAPADKKRASTSDAKSIKAPLPGVVLRIKKSVGDSVKEGDPLIILEAMKMETEVRASVDGTITAIAVNKGDQVSSGNVLVWIN